MEVLGSIYIDRFQRVAFVKYILSQIYNHCIQNCKFWLYGDCRNFCFLKKILPKSYVFFCPKTSHFHNPSMIGFRKLCDSSMNNIFNVLSIGLQYTLSFKWTDVGLKCLIIITSKGQSLNSRQVYEKFPILKQSIIVIHFLSLLIVIELSL